MFRRTDALRVAAYIARRFEEPTAYSMAVVLEFIVFGSTAQGERSRVRDLDISVLFLYDIARPAARLPTRLEEIECDMKGKGLVDISVDFTPLYIDVLWDAEMRDLYHTEILKTKIINGSTFIEDVLREFLLWNRATGQFQQSSIGFLIQKHCPHRVETPT